MSVTEKSKCPSHFDKAAAVAAVAAVAENNKHVPRSVLVRARTIELYKPCLHVVRAGTLGYLTRTYCTTIEFLCSPPTKMGIGQNA